MEENERDKGGEVEIWSWGAGTDGQLGTTRLEDEHLPQLLDLPRFSSAGPISLLACGGAHVLALTTDGKVVTWGRGTSGQLGHGDMVSSLQPKHVKLLESFVMTHVSAGWSHSGFVSGFFFFPLSYFNPFPQWLQLIPTTFHEISPIFEL